MLGTVRIARGMTQAELSRRSGVSQALISKVESGVGSLDNDRVSTLAKILDVPQDLLTTLVSEAGAPSTVFHRKRSTLPVSTANQLRAELDLTHLQVAGILGSEDSTLLLRREPLPDDGFDSPEDIARNIRSALELPSGPVLHLSLALETVGVVVIQRTLKSAQIDAIMSWPQGRRPLVMLGDHAPADRQRFTLAHELGHAVMHQVPTEDQEGEADRFASELLMPAASIRDQLNDLTIPKLAQLKSVWAVSMAALLRRARDLGTITDAQYRALNIEMSRSGYRTSEPVEVPRETPALVQRIIGQRMDAGETLAGLAASARMSENEFRALYLGDSP